MSSRGVAKTGRLPNLTLITIARALERLKAERRTAEGQQGESYAALLRKREELGSDATLARL
jgi:hypothetical protein